MTSDPRIEIAAPEYAIYEAPYKNDHFWIIRPEGDAELGNWFICKTNRRVLADMIVSTLNRNALDAARPAERDDNTLPINPEQVLAELTARLGRDQSQMDYFICLLAQEALCAKARQDAEIDAAREES